MKLLIIFDGDIKISPEKICVHVGHANRAVVKAYTDANLKKWEHNNFKTVIIKDKLPQNVRYNIEHRYPCLLKDAGLDGVFEPDTLLGYAVLVPDDCIEYKRLRLLKFTDKEVK